MLSTTLHGLFPDGVIVAELRGAGDPSELFPEEAAYLGRAVAKRAREFAAGRLCARRALAELGIRNFPLEVAADRRPLWPAGIAGSITHTEGFCAAAVADQGQFASLGIDSEAASAVKLKLWDSICRPEEIAWLGTLPEGERTAAATLIFSAKEAFYKCQYPLTTQSLAFHDAEVQVRWGEGRGAFTISATRALAFAEFASLPLSGQYLFHEQFVTAAVCLRRQPGRLDQ